ncbi:MAG: PorP/SprF family type IX secretion system membrane protein [Chitinophagaceae bacterium]|nr:PorP/SprF family type IX secretion system membrane protein [Chitinophagaceae bacterium]MCW5904618.1 PorP/SprF family type IX secretion system membrane protein [Chitinophagaceae bacterium]
MYKFLKIFFLFFAIQLVQSIHAQDLHFSQYFNAPLLVNPANTGFNPDFDYRVGGNYRNQWSSVTAYPYKTMNIWGDAQLFTERFENAWVGVGAAMLQDVAGSGSLTSTQAYASVAYHQLLGYSSLLSAGFNIGFTQKRIDLSKLTFNSQWNGKFFDINIPSGEPFSYNAVKYLSLQVGVNYSWFVNDNLYLSSGISVSNINRPNESFFSNTKVDTKIKPRYTFFANGSLKVNDVWILNPNFYYSITGSAKEIVFGGLLQRDLSAEGNGSLQLLAGAYYRVSDAMIPMIGFDIKNLKITFNYDVTSSSLKSYNNSIGAYEVSIVKNGLYKGKEKSIKCPGVRF